MLAHCIRALPDEGCGLFIGKPDGTVVEVRVAEGDQVDADEVMVVVDEADSA